MFSNRKQRHLSYLLPVLMLETANPKHYITLRYINNKLRMLYFGMVNYDKFVMLLRLSFPVYTSIFTYPKKITTTINIELKKKKDKKANTKIMDKNKISWLLCQLTSDLSRREDTARQSVLHSLMPVMLERQHTVS